MPQSTIFSEAEWIGFARHLPQPDAPAYTPPVHFPNIRDAKYICLDLETHDPDLLEKGPGVRRGAYIVGAAVAVPGFAEYYPLRHVVGENCDPDKVIAWLRDQLNGFRGEIIGANVALYDGDFLQAEGVRPSQAKWRDVQWAEALLDEHADSYSLNTLAKKYLGETKVTNELESLYGPEYINYFREVHPAHARAYALGDVNLPPRILEKQREQLAKERLGKLFDLECRLVPLLLYLRETGVRVDIEKAEQLQKVLVQKRDAEVQKMEKMVGFEVEYNTPASVVRALEKLGIPYPLTEKGNPSIQKQWLATLKHPFGDALNAARKYEKIRGTFVEGYILNGHINGRIHTQFHPLRRADDDGEAGTVSGRFSSSHPNLQNIPRRDKELGPLMRSMFLPDEGMKWWSFDLSQIEFRFLTHYAVAKKCTGAEIAQKMYQTNPKTDFHQMVMDLANLDRDAAKVANFAVVYGAGKKKFASQIGQVDANGEPTPKALQILATYKEKVPFARELYDMVADRATSKGFIRTILNRRARFPFWGPAYPAEGRPLAKDEALKEYGEDIQRYAVHKALNGLLQGSAADLGKVIPVNAWESGLVGPKAPLSLYLMVHDEFGGGVLPENEKFLPQFQEIMQSSLKLNVPILASGGIGKNWAEAK